MKKQQLINEINNLPKFELKRVALNDKEEWKERETFKAVTEVGKLYPFCFVTGAYRLIQMSDIFLPLLKKLDNIDGQLIYGNGMAIMDVFPDGEEFSEGNTKFGIVCYNSVNTQSAINIRFCITTTGITITIPSSIKGFKRVHVGKALELTTSYIEVIGKIKETWRNIIKYFADEVVTEEDAPELLKNLGIDFRLREKIKKELKEGAKMNLWDVFIRAIKIISEKQYKNEVNRRRRLDKLSKKVFDYAVASGL